MFPRNFGRDAQIRRLPSDWRIYRRPSLFARTTEQESDISAQRRTPNWRSVAFALSIVVVFSFGAINGVGASAADHDPNLLECTSASTDDSYALPPTPVQRIVGQSRVGTTWSGDYVQQALVTDKTDQYVGFYDASRCMTIAHRTVGETTWQTFAILGALAVTGWDSNDYIALALDNDGELHVSGNMHASALAYWVTTIAGDVTSLVNVPALVEPAIESHITYPTFRQTMGGELVFSYRQGGSGDGDAYLDSYDSSTKRWSPVLESALFSGTAGSPPRSAYFTITPAPDAAGYFA